MLAGWLPLALAAEPDGSCTHQALLLLPCRPVSRVTAAGAALGGAEAAAGWGVAVAVSGTVLRGDAAMVSVASWPFGSSSSVALLSVVRCR